MNDGFESYLYRIIVKFDEDNYLNIFIDNFKQLQDTLTSNYLTKKFSFFNNDIGIHQVKHIEVFNIKSECILTINAEDIYTRCDTTPEKIKDNESMVYALTCIYVNRIIRTIEEDSKLIRECMSRFVKEISSSFVTFDDINN